MAQGDAFTYSFKQIMALVNGLPGHGFGDSDGIRFEPSMEVYTSTVGLDGEVTRSSSNDLSGKIYITLKHTSNFNQVLDEFLQRSKTSGLDDKFPVYVEDLNSAHKFHAEKCWIESEPEMIFNKEVAEYEWVIKAAKVTTTRGGSVR